MFLRLLAFELVRLGTCPPGYEKKCPLQKQATTQVLREEPEKIVNRVFQILPKFQNISTPTSVTNQIIPTAFKNFSRTICGDTQKILSTYILVTAHHLEGTRTSIFK
ncbi:hypothetical protein M8J76_009341 [Diaphorina citri]|nr:hypothetical protein M8J76_009341 [Diaphorina citri]